MLLTLLTRTPNRSLPIIGHGSYGRQRFLLIQERNRYTILDMKSAVTEERMLVIVNN